MADSQVWRECVLKCSVKLPLQRPKCECQTSQILRLYSLERLERQISLVQNDPRSQSVFPYWSRKSDSRSHLRATIFIGPSGATGDGFGSAKISLAHGDLTFFLTKMAALPKDYEFIQDFGYDTSVASLEYQEGMLECQTNAFGPHRSKSWSLIPEEKGFCCIIKFWC